MLLPWLWLLVSLGAAFVLGLCTGIYFMIIYWREYTRRRFEESLQVDILTGSF